MSLSLCLLWASQSGDTQSKAACLMASKKQRDREKGVGVPPPASRTFLHWTSILSVRPTSGRVLCIRIVLLVRGKVSALVPLEKVNQNSHQDPLPEQCRWDGMVCWFAGGRNLSWRRSASSTVENKHTCLLILKEISSLFSGWNRVVWFFKRYYILSRLTSNLLHSWGQSWTLDPPVSII